MERNANNKSNIGDEAKRSEEPILMSPRRKAARAFLRSWPAMTGTIIFIGFAVIALAAGQLAPYGWDESVMEDAKQGPSWLREQEAPPLKGPSSHLLGTDHLGRDVFSRLVHGAKLSLIIGICSIGVALLIAIPWGLGTGYVGGWADMAGMRIIDILLAFPTILLAIILTAILEKTGPFDISSRPDELSWPWALIIAVGIVNVPGLVRQIRASTLSKKEQDFVTASRSLGAGPFRILFTDILPNILSPIIVLTTLGLGTAILEAAALGFLGLGLQADAPEWGNTLSQQRHFFATLPWSVYSPGVAIAIVVLGFNLLGDGLRDLTDPKQ